jgi:hypothetical protein
MASIMYSLAGVSLLLGIFCIGLVRSDIQIQIVIAFLLFAFAFLGLGSILVRLSNIAARLDDRLDGDSRDAV